MKPLGWRGWIALPLATCGLLAGQTFLATSAQAGIEFIRAYDTSGNAALSEPTAVTTDEFGNVYVVDTGHHRVVEFDADGKYVRQFGNGGSTTAGTDGHLYYPAGIAYSDGKVYVADPGGNDVQVFNSSGEFRARWSSSGALQFNSPDGISVVCGSLVLVANSRGPDGAGNVVELDTGGHYMTEFGHSNLAVPVGIVTDAPSDDTYGCALDFVYVADEYNGRIAQFDSQGTFLRYIGSQGAGALQFDHPEQLAYVFDVSDGQGPIVTAMLVAEGGNFRVQVLTRSGGGDWTSVGWIDKTPDGHLNDTHGVAVTATDHIVVAQTEDAHIYEYAFAPPALIFRFAVATKNYTKQTSALWFTLRYNQVENSCKVLVKATVTVPPNAAHVFSVEQVTPDVGAQAQKIKVGLSSRQLTWMEQAWQAGHNVPVAAKATATCPNNVHITKGANATFTH